MSKIHKIAMYYPRALYDADSDANSLWLWAESLERAGLEVEVLYDSGRPIRRQRPASCTIKTRPVEHRGRGRLRVPINLCRGLDLATLLVFRSGYVLFNIVAGEQAKHHGIPYVTIPMGAYMPQVRETTRAIRSVWEVAERRFLANAEAVHVYFDCEVSHVRSLAPRARTIVSPTGFDVPESRWRGGGEHRYVAWLGRYDVRHKGLDLLLDAMAMLPMDKRPLLKMHGRDSKDSRLSVQRMVSDRGLDADVSVEERIGGAEKEEFLLEASAFIHPARFESYGIALVENLAYGVPCVTTDAINLGPDLARADAALVVEATAAGVARGLASIRSGTLDAYGPRGRMFVEQELTHENAARRFLDGLDAVERVRGSR